LINLFAGGKVILETRHDIKGRVITQGKTLKLLAVESKLSYNRLSRIVNGFSEARPEEMAAICRTLAAWEQRGVK